MSDQRIGCDAAVVLPEFTRTLLDSFPNALHEPSETVWCEVSPENHPDTSHAAVIQSTPDNDYWIEWDNRTARLLVVQQSSEANLQFHN